MNYYSGELIELGDVVRFDIGPSDLVQARVVMLGSDKSHLEMNAEYLASINEIDLVEDDMIVAEYIDDKGNPLGNYIPTTILSIELIEKGSAIENS